MIVQFAREIAALLFLGVDKLLRELTHQPFGFRRTMFEDAQADDDHQGDDQSDEHGLPQQALEIVVERCRPPGHLGALRLEIRVV